MATILVTDGEQRAALAITRSLGRAGYRVVVLSASGRSLAGASRYAVRDVAVPPAGGDPEAFLAGVVQLAAEEKAEMLFPVTEEALLVLLAHRDAVPAAIPFADLDHFRAVSDKNHVLGVAQSIGIRVPIQYELNTPDDPPPPLSVPFVLKPIRSVWTAPDGTRGRVSVKWVRSREAYERTLRTFPPPAFPILAQEAITGPGTGVFLMLHEGRVLARFAHCRLLEKPPSGGVSVLSRSEVMDEELFEKSVRLLETLGWSGVAMVEFKRDASTGEAVLMEINGRFWGSLQLAIDAGVDFPALLAAATLGERPAPVMTYRPVRMRWEWGLVDHFGIRMKTGGRFSALSDVLKGVFARGEVLRLNDPKPFLRETMEWFRALR
ncbi:MAG: ATP-grasp domain-containing protein [Gemmatimonadota bacterium]|jgi:predicted ATP-grasp superfamily ATP-dependent carboligase|nr:ATP-grasp domain-containing protein [Gemmatimonadota bacterium]